MSSSRARVLGSAMFEVLLKIGYGDADVRFLMVNAIKPKLLEELYDFVPGGACLPRIRSPLYPVSFRM